MVILPAMVAITFTIYIVSGLPVSFILRRIRYPSFFLVIVILILPFVSGQTVIAGLGPLDLRVEGLLSVILITVRFLSILTISLVLFGTAPFLDTIKAMRALGLPAIIADMVLLSFRYLHEIGSDLRRMRISARLRGFHSRRFRFCSLKIPAWLSGSIIVRSYERSELIYKAMILRGYGLALPQDNFQIHTRDVVILIAFLAIAAGFIVGDFLCGHEATALLQWFKVISEIR
jgi:cobalt/nickel transport system permease protein